MERLEEERNEKEKAIIELSKEVEKDRQVEITASRKRNRRTSFKGEMENKLDDKDDYLVHPNKVPSDDEPIDLQLSRDERLLRCSTLPWVHNPNKTYRTLLSLKAESNNALSVR